MDNVLPSTTNTWQTLEGIPLRILRVEILTKKISKSLRHLWFTGIHHAMQHGAACHRKVLKIRSDFRHCFKAFSSLVRSSLQPNKWLTSFVAVGFRCSQGGHLLREPELQIPRKFVSCFFGRWYCKNICCTNH